MIIDRDNKAAGFARKFQDNEVSYDCYDCHRSHLYFCFCFLDSSSSIRRRYGNALLP